MSNSEWNEYIGMCMSQVEWTTNVGQVYEVYKKKGRQNEQERQVTCRGSKRNDDVLWYNGGLVHITRRGNICWSVMLSRGTNDKMALLWVAGYLARVWPLLSWCAWPKIYESCRVCHKRGNLLFHYSLNPNHPLSPLSLFFSFKYALLAYSSSLFFTRQEQSFTFW